MVDWYDSGPTVRAADVDWLSRTAVMRGMPKRMGQYLGSASLRFSLYLLPLGRPKT